MKLGTAFKFIGFCATMLAIPILLSCGFFYIFESHQATYLGFLIGIVLDTFLFVVVFERLFRSTIKYLNKKEREKELVSKEEDTF